MPRPGPRTTGLLTVLVTLGLVAFALVTRGGTLFSPGDLAAKSRPGVSLGGVSSHAEIDGNCAACHAPAWSKETMASRCLACHADVAAQLAVAGPMHGKLPVGTECRSCHTEHNGPDGTLTSMAAFHHDFAAFKLTGKHAAVDCKSCHVNDTFKGTPQTCVSCHAEPQVHKGRFGTACVQCHSTSNWKATAALGSFNHDLAAFKLTGKHTKVDCKSCHVNDTFKGTPPTCMSCHAEPQVHKGRFGTGCAQCHTTATWKDLTAVRNFNHDLAAFKLTGKHTKVDCAACHANNVFKGTPQSCVACHAEPKVHKAKFGTACAQCHTTTTWAGATFKHKFPLNHGRRGTNACATCHKTPDNYRAHMLRLSRARTDADRQAASTHLCGELENCAVCHATGRGGRGQGRADGPILEWLAADEPACEFLLATGQAGLPRSVKGVEPLFAIAYTRRDEVEAADGLHVRMRTGEHYDEQPGTNP